MRRSLIPALALALLAACGGSTEEKRPLTCAAGQALCAGSCADVLTDGVNCGSCGNVCGGETVCAGGLCELFCAPDRIECGTSCVAYATDLLNCGACGNVCAHGTVCIAKGCEPVCAPKLTRCGPALSATCVDLSSDALHCGGCDAPCAAGLACEGGLCVIPCPLGQLRCGGQCVGVDVKRAGLGLPGVRASPTAGAPYALVLIQADAGGVPDLVVAESTATGHQLELLRGVGDGTFLPFDPPSIIPLDFNPSVVVAGDVTGDGKVDLVVGTSDGTITSVTILTGDGLGHFADAGLPALASGASPRSLAIGDLDWDGDLDLVVGNGAGVATGNLRVFLNDGAGVFGLFAGAGIPRAANFGYSVLGDVRQVAIGSFDFDYAADLLAVSAGTAGNPGGEVLTGRGDGTGSLTQPTLNGVKTLAFGLPSEPTAMVAADLDGDFVLDWAVAHATTNELTIFINPDLDIPQSIFDVAQPVALAAADLDGNGRIDLVTANAAVGASYFHANLEPAFGGIRFERALAVPAGDGPSAVAAVTLANGDPCVVTANEGGWNLSAARSALAGRFVAPVTYPTSVSAEAVALGRFDGDALIDFAAASVLTNEVRLFRQSRPSPPAADFTEIASVTLPIDAAPSALASGDLDGDGAEDLVVALRWLALVDVLWGDGTGNLATPVELAVGAEPAAILLAQLDDYAGLDIASADSGSNQVTVIPSMGMRTFGAATIYATGPRPVALAAADLDGQGCLDLVTANSGNGTLSILHCTTSGAALFQPATSIAACAGARSVAAGRVDTDLLPDLVVGCASGMVLFRNLGAGLFDAGTAFGAGVDPAAMQLADLDGDGLVDLVVASPRDGGIALLRGTPGGGFSPPEIYTAGGSPVGLAIGPIDGDGQLDVVAAVTRPSTALIGAGAAFLAGTCTP
jgi:hypothetical protein